MTESTDLEALDLLAAFRLTPDACRLEGLELLSRWALRLFALEGRAHRFDPRDLRPQQLDPQRLLLDKRDQVMAIGMRKRTHA